MPRHQQDPSGWQRFTMRVASWRHPTDSQARDLLFGGFVVVFLLAVLRPAMKGLAASSSDPVVAGILGHWLAWLAATGLASLLAVPPVLFLSRQLFAERVPARDRDTPSYRAAGFEDPELGPAAELDEPDSEWLAQQREGSELLELRTPDQLSLSRLRHELGMLTKLDEPAVVPIVDRTLAAAIALKASDVHFEPRAAGVDLRYRIDGTLVDVIRLPIAIHGRLMNRLKVMSQVPSFDRDEPHDGRIFAAIGGRQYDVRISFMPTISGEKAVLRVLESTESPFELDTLGFSPHILEPYCDILRRPQGIVIVTGPTGSGKTTTIYGSLRYIRANSDSMVNIVTIEDPVEYAIAEFSQTQVKEEAGLTFAKGLRTLLRQDPDVIMVGEIRDAETAEIAAQAGLTGHLMLTTVHADSAAGVFSRLVNMGIEPFLLASSTAAVLSQRLVRKLCPWCREHGAVGAAEMRTLRESGMDLTTRMEFFIPRGCEHCHGSGFSGRTPLAELLVIDEPIRQLIVAKATTNEITARARRQGLSSLLENGIIRALDGTTTIAEVLRVTR